jgi:SET domain
MPQHVRGDNLGPVRQVHLGGTLTASSRQPRPDSRYCQASCVTTTTEPGASHHPGTRPGRRDRRPARHRPGAAQPVGAAHRRHRRHDRYQGAAERETRRVVPAGAVARHRQHRPAPSGWAWTVSFPGTPGEPSAVHVLPPGQPLLFHRDQRQPGRVHCRRQLLCQRQAGRAHRVVAARRVRWRAGGFHLAAVEGAEYEPVMLFINHSCEPNVGFAGNTVLVAMRDISPGEELTTDYALFDDYAARCNAGAERYPAAPRSATRTGSGQTCSASTATTSLLISCTG